MKDFLLGISLTVNIIGFLAIFLYFKIKFLGMKKFQKDLESKFFVQDDDLDDMLNKL